MRIFLYRVVALGRAQTKMKHHETTSNRRICNGVCHEVTSADESSQAWQARHRIVHKNQHSSSAQKFHG